MTRPKTPTHINLTTPKINSAWILHCVHIHPRSLNRPVHLLNTRKQKEAHCQKVSDLNLLEPTAMINKTHGTNNNPHTQ